MAKSYRNQMTPGMKKCIDYMRGKTTKEEESVVKNELPKAYKSKK
jgi:hypothetical protein